MNYRPLLPSLVVVVAALGILGAIAASRYRRAKGLEANEQHELENDPEPTEAEIRAAEISIRTKTAESIRKTKANLVRSLGGLLVLSVAVMPFLHEMPLNSYFRPIGQLLIIAWALAFLYSVIGAVALIANLR